MVGQRFRLRLFASGIRFRPGPWWSGWLASVLLLVAVPTQAMTDEVRATTAGFIRDGRQAFGAESMRAYVVRSFGERAGRLPGSRELNELAVVADCALLLDLLQRMPWSPAVEWVLSSDARLELFVETLHPDDRLPQVLTVMNQLLKHDPQAGSEYENLMLALALAWDQPRRPPVHRQMGPEPLAYEADIGRRYDFFKQLYASGKARIAYDRLSVSDLLFVVETPVPLSELEWARDNEGGSASSWKKKFYDIKYAQGRLMSEGYAWPHGSYTLEKIKSHGGICVDQAYYAVMTARANGIPAIYFSGMGSTSGHAWFSYLRGPGRWELDVGRYESQNYTTGEAVHPQTGKPMTDHEVIYTCERSLYSSDYTVAGRWTRIARVLLEAGAHAEAVACTRQARRLLPRYEAPWNLEQEALEGVRDDAALEKLLAEKASVFRKYTDILVAAERERIVLLHRMGDSVRAGIVLRDLISKVRTDKRDDLVRELIALQVESREDPVRARKELERLLNSQVEEGQKLVELMQEYLRKTREDGQTREAVRFMEKFIGRLRKMYGWQMTPVYEKRLLHLLRQAYENDGNERGAAETREIISSLN